MSFEWYQKIIKTNGASLLTVNIVEATSPGH